jgi:predicted type IV restriction endonuclease
MTISPDESLEKFKKIISQNWSDLSEADTRSKIIDPIFKDCLGWEEKDITREESINQGFIDYVFAIDSQTRFVIEAKKNGVAFEIPEDFSKRSYLIEGTLSKDQNIKKAIEQVSRYCYEKGIKFAVITNGKQFIIFEGIKIGGEWRKGKCLMFKDHKDIEDNFVLFWNLFNKSSVREGSFNKIIVENAEILNFQRPLEVVHNREDTLIRNDLNQYIRPFIDYLFEEITQEEKEKVLRECYIHDKAFIALDEGMKTYFEDKMPYFSEKYDIKYFKEDKNSAGLFTMNFRACENFLHQNSPRGSVVLLIGGIGSGKTTFLHRFFKVILGDRKMLLNFYIDFRESPITEDKLEEYIYRKMIDVLKMKYSKIKDSWFKEQGLVEPDESNLQSYFTCIAALLKSVGYNIAIILDNVDQHSRELQQKIFQVTKSICDSQRMIAILSLREESFVEATQKGVHDAYFTTGFHIPSPVFRKLILARLNYAITLLSKKDIDEIKKEVRTQLDISEDKRNNLLDFFKIIRDSIDEGGQGSSINNFLTSISAGDMRKALKMFNNFLTSGNTNILEILNIYRTKGFYKIPYHAFIKSVILGDSKYYLSDKNASIHSIFLMLTQAPQAPIFCICEF